MAEKTNISWCDSSCSFWVGCTRVSPACTFCYAEKEDRRHLHEPISHWGKGAPRYKCKGAVKSLLAMNRKPWICDQCGMAHSNATVEGWENTGDQRGIFCAGCNGITTMHRRKVFINQQSDIFDPEVEIEMLAEALNTIRQCPDIDHMLLTKRPELWRERVEGAHDFIRDQREPMSEDLAFLKAENPKLYREAVEYKTTADWLWHWFINGVAPHNIMLGTTVEDQPRTSRIDDLLKIPAVFRFLSVEPQLEDIVLPKLDGINLLINGGESGPNARPFNLQWARNLRDQCKQADVAFYMKQLGSRPVFDIQDARGKYCGYQGLDLKDRSGANKKEWPEDLRVQEPFSIDR